MTKKKSTILTLFCWTWGTSEFFDSLMKRWCELTVWLCCLFICLQATRCSSTRPCSPTSQWAGRTALRSASRTAPTKSSSTPCQTLRSKFRAPSWSRWVWPSGPSSTPKPPPRPSRGTWAETTAAPRTDARRACWRLTGPSAPAKSCWGPPAYSGTPGDVWWCQTPVRFTGSRCKLKLC